MLAFIADVRDLLVSVSFEDVGKVWAETPLVDFCRIGIETHLGDLGVGTSLGTILSIGAATSL